MLPQAIYQSGYKNMECESVINNKIQQNNPTKTLAFLAIKKRDREKENAKRMRNQTGCCELVVNSWI
jgi:hypothetical protein